MSLTRRSLSHLLAEIPEEEEGTDDEDSEVSCRSETSQRHCDCDGSTPIGTRWQLAHVAQGANRLIECANDVAFSGVLMKKQIMRFTMRLILACSSQLDACAACLEQNDGRDSNLTIRRFPVVCAFYFFLLFLLHCSDQCRGSQILN